MLAYLFPGQGAQIKGMGKELFAQFSDYTAQADELLGYSIEELCIEDPQQLLNQTQYTQPALYVVNAFMYLKILADTSQQPDYVAGHSLGEYNALFAAGVFDFITGLALVKKRGELMSQAQDGGMAAVLGLSQQELMHIIQTNNLSTVTIANYNSYQQLVISGPKADIKRTQEILAPFRHATFISLSVSGAFHSPYMLSAQQAFAGFLHDFEFTTPCLPVIANVDASAYHPLVLKTNLINQITHSVQWIQTIEYLQSKANIRFQEVGPGSVLTGLLRRIQNKQ
ncbi:ACP S-malonyltransferase [Legionella drancourtii]|uniref:Malonyl CoA-acyl carrier protein transacylase n=1 Tax=Legionella drancourtii LLAP12 TaxID=658187 RepID=G9EKV0_9GAMM|nr:ACP S-malonyltransferase [Legionella drancourtii]EHL32061.1 BaeC [Legionella drancourtii LLAP12]